MKRGIYKSRCVAHEDKDFFKRISKLSFLWLPFREICPKSDQQNCSSPRAHKSQRFDRHPPPFKYTHTHTITPPAPSSHTLVRCNRMPRWPSQLANPTIQVRPVSPQGHGTVYCVLGTAIVIVSLAMKVSSYFFNFMLIFSFVIFLCFRLHWKMRKWTRAAGFGQVSMAEICTDIKQRNIFHFNYAHSFRCTTFGSSSIQKILLNTFSLLYIQMIFKSFLSCSHSSCKLA